MTAGRPRDLLLHPVVLVAIALLVVNDHVLKSAAPSWWTGKLSDLAGLVFFPLVLAACVDGVHRAARPRRLVATSAAWTAVVFTLVKTLPAATDAFRWAVGALQWPLQALASGSFHHAVAPVSAVTDPTDLFALPACAVALYLGSTSGTLSLLSTLRDP